MTLAFERVTIFCRNLDRSLDLYCGVLGLVPVEKKTICGPAAGGLLQLAGCTMRIVLLAPAAEAGAVLGLFEISKVDGDSLDEIRAESGRPHYGQTAVVVSTDDFDGMHKKLKEAGTLFLTPPLTYPKRQASERSPAGLYHEMIFYDPDGVLVSVMQVKALPTETK